MKRINIAATLTAVLLIAVTALVTRFLYGPGGMGTVSVGFIYENDESTPYTYNFALAERALKAEYGDRVNVYAFRNVLESETKEPLLELVPENCDEYAEAYRLRKFLRYIKPIPDQQIPPTSLLREFLGGSSFKY